MSQNGQKLFENLAANAIFAHPAFINSIIITFSDFSLKKILDVEDYVGLYQTPMMELSCQNS